MKTIDIDFNEIKKKIMPYFIKIYGHEYEKLINERFNKIVPIFYTTLKTESHKMITLQKKKRIELTIKLLEHHNIYLPENIKNDLLIQGTTINLLNYKEAAQILTKYFGPKSIYNESPYLEIKQILRTPNNNIYKIKDSIEYLKLFGINLKAEEYNNWLLTPEAKKFFTEIDNMLAFLNKLDEEFKTFNEQFNELKKALNKSDKLKQEIDKKYMLEFLKSIKKFMTKDDQEKLANYEKSPEKNWTSFKNSLNILKIIGDSIFLEYNSILNFFSIEASEKLNNPDTWKFEKEEIIKKRIEYYRLIGLYQNQMPNDEYLVTTEAINNAPPKELVETILNNKKNYKSLAEEEYLTATSTFKHNKEQIDNLNLLNKSEFGLQHIEQGIHCIIPSVILKNENTDSLALLIFCPDNCIKGYTDTFFIHEINHGLELSLLDFSDNKPIYKSGFEVIIDDDKPRMYEQFSEVINQEIAMAVTELMHQDNIYLFDNPQEAKIHWATSYENQQFLILDFWKIFKHFIIAARTNNLNTLLDIVGKENFEKLNEVINEHVKIPYYKMMDDLINNRTTELTKKRDELISRSQQILKNMIIYAKKNANITLDIDDTQQLKI